MVIQQLLCRLMQCLYYFCNQNALICNMTTDIDRPQEPLVRADLLQAEPPVGGTCQETHIESPVLSISSFY